MPEYVVSDASVDSFKERFDELYGILTRIYVIIYVTVLISTYRTARFHMRKAAYRSTGQHRLRKEIQMINNW